MNTAEPAIEVNGLSHAFALRRALRGVSLVVPAGDVHGLVGPNGAGKTTLLKILATALPLQGGVVRVLGLEPADDPYEIRRRTGYLPESPALFGRMTLVELLDYTGAVFGLTPDQRDRVITDLLELVDLAHRRDELVGRLSRGLQRRIALARVLVHDPDLLLLDEPLAGIDPRSRIELIAILRELAAQGKTVLVSSHILDELATLCDHLSVLDAGRVCFSGSVDELVRLRKRRCRLELAEAVPGAREELEGLERVVVVESLDEGRGYMVELEAGDDDCNGLLADVLKLGLPVASFTRDERSLGRAFLELTGGGTL